MVMWNNIESMILLQITYGFRGNHNRTKQASKIRTPKSMLLYYVYGDWRVPQIFVRLDEKFFEISLL